MLLFKTGGNTLCGFGKNVGKLLNQLRHNGLSGVENSVENVDNPL